MADAEQFSPLEIAENAFLGSVLCANGEKQNEAYSLLEQFDPDSFSTEAGRKVAHALWRLRGKVPEVNSVALIAELGVMGCYAAIDGYNYLLRIIESSMGYAPGHGEDLRKLQAKGRAGRLMKSIHESMSTGHEVNGQLDELRAALAEMKGKAEEPKPPPGYAAADLLTKILPPIDYIIQPIASIGNLTMLQGEPKSGKSCFALYVAISASLGAWCAGRLSCTAPRRVLFITYEDGLLRICTRLKQYVRGLSSTSMPDTLTVYSHETAPILRLETPQGCALLKAMIRQYRAELVVLDTLSHLHGCEENSKKEMQPVLDALKDIARDLRCAILLLHHSGKPNKEQSRSIAYRARGSSAISAAADIIIDWGDRGSTNITPCKLISKDDDSDEFAVVYSPTDDGSIRWELQDAEAAGDAAGNRAKVLHAVQEIHITSPEGVGRRIICDVTGLTYNTVKMHLQTLQDQGELVMIVHGQKKLWFPK